MSLTRRLIKELLLKHCYGLDPLDSVPEVRVRTKHVEMATSLCQARSSLPFEW
ncbi:hypothetical protein IFVP177_C1170040 [Vibrio parahaemolyticus]